MDLDHQNDRNESGSAEQQENPAEQAARNSQDSSGGQNNPYGNYIPPEIPIPDIKNAKNTGPFYGQNNIHQNNVYQNQNMEPPYGPYVQQYMPQDQKKGTVYRVLAAVACVFVLLLIVAGTGIAYFMSTAPYKIGRGLFNLGKEMAQVKNPLSEKLGVEDIMVMMEEEGSHVGTRLNFTSESLYGSTFGIDSECYKDVQNKELSADTSISMMNYEFAHLNIYADEESFCFSIPELFMENLYIDNENVVSQYNRSFWAEWSGISDMEDFSFDFFADGDESLSPGEWRTLDSFMERYAADLEACRDKLVMEKAEKGFYRIVYPEKEMDRLLRDLLENYESVYEMTSEEEWWKEYDSLIDSDISVLYEINRQNRIESIVIEEPVKMLDGTASMEGSIYLLGSRMSIDKIQGELAVESGDGVERSIHFQTAQTLTEDTYDFDMDLELTEEKDSLLRMNFVSNSDAERDEFNMSFSMWDDEEDIELSLEGSLDDIVRGRSLEMDLEELAFYLDGEELFKVTGDILIEPLDEEVKRTVKRGTAFFEMTEEDWWDILYKIDDEYGGLMNYLW